MNKLFKFSAFVLAIAGLASSCVKNTIDTEQLPQDMMYLSAMAPVPVVRGAELRIYGTGLDQVVSVEIPGVNPITEIEHVNTEGKVKEIRVIVPKEGPQEGKVSIVDKSGNRSTSKFNLTYDETSLVFDGFEAAEVVMPGDVITIKGDYINTVKEVIFAGGADGNGAYAVGESITEQDRHSAKIVVPADAITGIIKVGTVNEIADKNSIPVVIPSEKEVVVGEPTINPIGEVKAKVGDAIDIEGKYLNMIKEVAFGDVVAEDFVVNTEGTRLGVTVPSKATEGVIILTSYAGVEYTVDGLFIPILPGNLAIAPDNKQDRYKAGLQVMVTGETLSVVSAVCFGGIDVTSWIFTPGTVEDGSEAVPVDTIRCIIPELAPDGDVIVKMNNGSEVIVGSLEYVKPTFTDAGPSEIVARQDFDLRGEDLELITDITIGGIKCQFCLDSLGVRQGFDEENQPIEIPVFDSTLVHVTTAPDILSGDVAIAIANGYTEVINNVVVSYDEPVSITYKKSSIQLGEALTIEGENLFLIEAISIKGKKISNYVTKTNSEMSFYLPEGMGPGIYRLDLTLIDGMKLTWAIPFEMTAPYTETTMWEGEVDLGNWSLNWEMKPADMFVAANAKEGDVFRIYGYATNEWWQIQTFDGHWGALDMGLGNGNNVNAGIYDLSNGYIAIELDATRVQAYTQNIDWGYSGILQGENFVVTQLSLIKWGAAEKVTNIWEGSWACAGWAGNQDLAWGGYDWSTVKAGTKLRLTMTPTVAEGSWWCVSLRHGADWGNLPAPVPGQYDTPEGGILELELTDIILNDLVSNGGLVITGDGFTLTSVDLVEAGGPAEIETTLWEGDELVDDWSVQPFFLSDGGAELKEAGATAGQKVRFYITPTEDAWKLQIIEGHWGPAYCSYCSLGNDTEEGKFTEYDLAANKGFIAITLTQEMLDAAFSVGYWGGTFLGNGDNVKVTKITLL